MNVLCDILTAILVFFFYIHKDFTVVRWTKFFKRDSQAKIRPYICRPSQFARHDSPNFTDRFLCEYLYFRKFAFTLWIQFKCRISFTWTWTWSYLDRGMIATESCYQTPVCPQKLIKNNWNKTKKQKQTNNNNSNRRKKKNEKAGEEFFGPQPRRRAFPRPQWQISTVGEVRPPSHIRITPICVSRTYVRSLRGVRLSPLDHRSFCS